ncbi:hypothetical protein ACFSC6_06485 [Rufibacter sediminis]|uniref:Uncharacterized protein n=1 Tax=Rufibacter sediminis TaxID=2762756 RepID=A0ABR6VSK6_9BACT|nr:hypothetical protein [Rufibacter sediminis]MBC3540183.1 hypothetical protein [Rufibacter sediminis]
MISKKISCVALLALLGSSVPTQAQVWKNLQKTIEDKASKKVEDMLTGGTKAATTATSPSKMALPELEETYSFVPGRTIVFASDFKNDVKGRMPKHWKSNSTGSISSVSGVPGKWLALNEKTTYKIDSLLSTPGNFTIEFDLLTRSSEAADIGSMSFGFARDNSNRNHITDAYNDNAITETEFHFHNREITNSSSDTRIYNTIKFPFANYANELLHVAISVEGENLSVYVNKTKVLDTNMFKPKTAKYFYLTAPYSYDLGSKVYFSNFVMAKN